MRQLNKRKKIIHQLPHLFLERDKYILSVLVGFYVQIECCIWYNMYNYNLSMITPFVVDSK